MRYLVISDIHGNWEALQAVLESAEAQYDRVICCGDFIGYGADPNRVVDWAREHVHVAIRGNHDRVCATLEDLDWFSPVARAAALWTHDALSPDNSAYVRNLAEGPRLENGFAIVHGSPIDEDEYLTTVAEASRSFSGYPEKLVFFGHTHIQGGFEWSKRRVSLLEVEDSPALLELRADDAYLLNPGSVGQPRDGDPKAAFILFDPAEEQVLYRRVKYDIEAAQQKIRMAGLPRLLADRLALGR